MSDLKIIRDQNLGQKINLLKYLKLSFGRDLDILQALSRFFFHKEDKNVRTIRNELHLNELLRFKGPHNISIGAYVS